MSGRPWIKQATSKIDDARLAQCSDATQRDYFMLYLLAGRLDADGLFIENGRQLSEDEIAFKIRIKAARLKASINEMKKARLVHVNGKGPQIMDYANEQQSWREKQDADRERQARHRYVTRDSETVTSDGERVTPLEESQSQIRESLLLLSPAQRELITSRHPDWMMDALKIAKAKNKVRPQYIAGIVKNWIVEGRTKERKPANQRGASKRSTPKQPVLTGAARDKALKAAQSLVEKK